MILGVLDRRGVGSELQQELLRVAQAVSAPAVTSTPSVWTNQRLGLCWAPTGIESLDEAPQPFLSEDGEIAAVFEGKIYNAEEIRDALGVGHRMRRDASGEVLVHLYEKHGDSLLESANGKFAFALWDDRNQRLLLGTDRLGIEPLFYFDDGQRLSFASSLRALMRAGWIDKRLSPAALLQYVLYSYNPGHPTLIRGVKRLPAGHLLAVENSSPALKRYWHLSFAEICIKREEEYCEDILELIESSIRLRVESGRVPGVLLSGGTDSSAIVSLASRMSDEPIRTFSFRCTGRSYDESSFARFVSQEYGTRHQEIDYGPEALGLMTQAVSGMDEPFCDIGIEIGTYLLGRAAEHEVSYVLSGEGGDELFGGHPVYTADKFAAIADLLPGAIRRPAARLLQAIPDSTEKNDLQVKLKRFAYGLSFPAELGSRRWAAYYTPVELRQVCTRDLLEQCDLQALFEPVAAYGREADGNDLLSRSLYCDYHTLVSFYLRRLRLLRAFSIESRLPLLDHRLVEYAATVPSRLKLRGLSQSKYIYRKALEKVLPRRILYDRPKLGHSVPMKNWLREDSDIREWVGDVLSEEAVLKRGLFRPEAVQRLIEEHLSKRHNHSHRIWGLLVLELWMREWLDG